MRAISLTRRGAGSHRGAGGRAADEGAIVCQGGGPVGGRCVLV